MIMKNSTLIFLSFIILSVPGCSVGKKIIYTDVNEYSTYLSELDKATDFMPELVSLGNYSEIEVNYYYQQFIWTVKTISLIVTYSNIDYQEQKNLTFSNYAFLQAPIIDTDGDAILSNQIVICEGYAIQVVDDEAFLYPKRFGLIGYSDAMNQIIFMYAFDKEISVISDLEGYINDYFIVVTV